MVRKILTSLKGIIGEAHRRGLVAQNAAATVRMEIDRRQKGQIEVARDVPSIDEIQTTLSKAAHRWRPLLVTAIFTAMRGSELRGLTWKGVDFDRNTIHVRQRANLWGEIGAPKSRAGYREMPMSPLVVNRLKEWKLARPPGSAHLAFPNGNGRVEYHANIANRGFLHCSGPQRSSAGRANQNTGCTPCATSLRLGRSPKGSRRRRSEYCSGTARSK